MISCELDPDVVRWGLHHLDVCSISNSGSPLTVTQYDTDLSRVESVSEGYFDTTSHSHTHTNTNVENDELIARAFQEELSRISNVEAYGSSSNAGGGGDNFQASVLAQDWIEPSKILSNSGIGHEEVDESADKMGNVGLCSSSQAEDMSSSPEITDESAYDGEVGKRLTHMVPIPHVPKINGDIPSVDEATSDHQRLLNRLELYDLVELKIQGDGNCQFRAVSDQLYRTSEHHKFVRNQVVDQLKSHLGLYEGYVPMSYGDYLKKMSKTGEWGDHVTLQAAADSYGVKIFVLTSFKDTCYIEILPHIQKSERVIFLSFWAEVHYNSIYPADDFPATENKKKKKWWAL